MQYYRDIKTKKLGVYEYMFKEFCRMVQNETEILSVTERHRFAKLSKSDKLDIFYSLLEIETIDNVET